MKKYALLTTSALICSMVGISTALALATQGTPGATSAGDLIVSMTITNDVNVTNLADIVLGNYGGADLTGSSPVCVYFNAANNYQITIDSNDTPGTFALEDGASNTIPYTVTYDDTNGAQAVTAGVAITGMDTGGNTTDDDCSTATADNGTLAVSVLATDITGNPNGTYAETLDISVAPDI